LEVSVDDICRPTILRTQATAQSYPFGIEEEYFVSSLATRNACRTMPRGFIEACRAHPVLRECVSTELLQSQIEIATPVLQRVGEALPMLEAYRNALAEIGEHYEVGNLAAGTHPRAVWSQQRPTDSARYRKLMRDLQMLGARNMVCGLHVHVGVPEPGKRIDLMVRMIPFVPLLLALSTSSPFWQARRTGLMGYRLAAYDELPRTGLPDLFRSAQDYEHYIDALKAAGAVADASFVWWAVRPSLANPTLELRVADSCTYAADAVTIATLFRLLVRRLDRDPSLNENLTAASRAIALENKWRAQRYGIHGTFVDEHRRCAIDIQTALEDVLHLVADDAEDFGCTAVIEAAQTILKRGTSADRQLAIYRYALAQKRGRTEALAAVVDWLIVATRGTACESGLPLQ
jgi:glutamate---cysteine ligase / carboxylate-amine ligase